MPLSLARAVSAVREHCAGPRRATSARTTTASATTSAAWGAIGSCRRPAPTPLWPRWSVSPARCSP